MATPRKPRPEYEIIRGGFEAPPPKRKGPAIDPLVMKAADEVWARKFPSAREAARFYLKDIYDPRENFNSVERNEKIGSLAKRIKNAMRRNPKKSSTLPYS